MKINLRSAKVWSEIPDVWKNYNKPKQQDYKADPTDKGLASILSVFASTDDLRPAMTGVFFDKENITVTDGHSLFILPNTGTFEDLYEIGSKKTIDAKYPQYRVVIPEDTQYKHKINISKLKTYCNVVVNGKYSNMATNSLILKYGGGKDRISFNAKFLIEILTAFEKLGYVDIYIGLNSNNRGAIFTVEQKDLFKISSAYGKRPLALQMPLMMNNVEYQKLGAYDIDFQRELQVLYDLSTDAIIDANGKEVTDWQPKSDWGLPYWDIEEARVFTKITNSKMADNLPILEYVKIQNKKIVATDLSLAYCLNDADVEDGLYEIVNLALVDTPDFDIENYPLDVWKNHEFKENEKFNLNIGAIIEASKFIGDDEIREAMTGVHIETGKGITKVESTDAHSLFSVQKDINASRQMGDKGLKYDTNVVLGSINLLVPCLKTLNMIYPVYGVSATKNYTYLRDTRHQIYVKNIDAKYPDFNNVLISKLDGVLNFEADQLFRFFKDLKLKGKDAKIHFKVSGNDVTVSSYNEGVLSKVGVIKGNISEKTNYQKPDCYVGLMHFKDDDIDTGVLFNYNQFKSVLGTAYKYGKRDGNNLSFDFDSRGLYLCEIDNLDFLDFSSENKKEKTFKISKKPVSPKEITEKPTKNEDKAQIMATINALKYIDDEDAKKTIKALKILLQNM